jgi:branched-chain amino acid transport system substrate-binding protein
MLTRLRLAAGFLALATVGAAGCGGDDPADSRPAPGDALRVYLSAPKQGDSAQKATAVAVGARLALRDAGSRAGGFRVRLVELNSSDPDADPALGGGWDPAAVSRNAERAADDPTAIAYIGELDLGGSAISVPITNDAGILQVSPGDGLTSLTRELPGTGGPGPERYYPDEEPSFLRLVPIDFLQASALVRWAGLSGARRLALVHDGSLFGRDLLAEAALVASCERLRVVDPERVGPDVTHYSQVAERIAEERPDAVLYAGAAGSIASPLTGALEQRLPSVRLFGAGGVADQPSTRAVAPNALLSTDREPIRVVRSARPRSSYPSEGTRVLRRVAAVAGRPVPTEVLYGYEAMSLVLDAIEAAARSSEESLRAAVRRQALVPRTRRSVLGSYRISAAGDVSQSRFGGYRRELGALEYEGIQRPGYRLPPGSQRSETNTDDPCSGLSRHGPRK